MGLGLWLGGVSLGWGWNEGGVQWGVVDRRRVEHVGLTFMSIFASNMMLLLHTCLDNVFGRL